MKLTPGKLAGMKAVSDKRGVIAAAAMDQRGSLQKALAKEKGAEVSTSMLEEFKSIVTEVLAFQANRSDHPVETSLPLRCGDRSDSLSTLEETGYDKTDPVYSGTRAEKGARPSARPMARAANQPFALIFLSVMTMVFMFVAASTAISWYSHDKDLLSKQADALMTMAKYGFAAIIGLLIGWKLRNNPR
jgi:cytochrome bd-type quinol oxidase subunit 1